MSSLKLNIKDFALESGFSTIGFASASKSISGFELFTEWIAKGYHADMKWLDKNHEKRQNIENILPGAKTVIVTTTNYLTDFSYHNLNSYGKISRYAWGDDYHNVILPKLELIAEKISELFPCSISKCYVDTGPILEKQWAVAAGIGWQGKNSLIMNKKDGSWFFIGIIITTAEFEPDSPLADHCGKCDLCMKSCPTDAIIAPKVIDSNKCISYWTIEAKADRDIPFDIAGNMNSWIFGCDICQDVCPWNRKVKPVYDKVFSPRLGQTQLKLDDLIEMTDEDFRLRFSNSPVKRPKLAGMKRNANILLSQQIKNITK